MSIERPTEAEYASFYRSYVALVPETDVLAVLAAQGGELRQLLAGVAPGREGFRYAPGKWSIRELVGHLSDGERVFGYRAFCFSRGERQPLPGFEENEYVSAAGSEQRRLADLVAEFAAVRESNLAALRVLDASAWQRVGNANGSPITVRALAYVMAGHVRHHGQVLRERYAVSPLG